IGHVLRRRVPLRGSLRQSLQTNTFQFFRNAVVNLPGRTWLKGRDLLQQFFRRFTPERTPAGEPFVKDHAETKNVTAAINPVPFTTSLLWRHIGRRPSVAWPLADIL